MKTLRLLLMAGLAVLAFSCKKHPVEPEPQKVDPEAPTVISAQLKGANGEAAALVGTPLKFKAEVAVKGSKLASWTLEIKKDDAVIGTSSGELSGETAKIEKEINLTIDPESVLDAFWPSVKFTVTNSDKMTTEKELAQSDNVQITIPALLEALFLVDNNGKLFQMDKTAIKGEYRTSADLSEIGTSFTIAEKVTGTAVDPSGKTWEFETPAVVIDDTPIGLRWLGFNVFSEKLSKFLNYTITMDANKMANDDPYKVYWSFTLYQDCEVVFNNFADGLLLQADRFADVKENTARFIGADVEKQEIYYVPDTKWLIVKDQWSAPANNVLWVTGSKASLPMAPYCEVHPMDWFNNTPNSAGAHSTANFVRIDEENWDVLLYLDEDFALKIYDQRAWASELSWTSGTPDLLTITPIETNPETGEADGNYAKPGPSFTKGLYTLSYNKVTEVAKLTPYTADPLPGVKGVEVVPETPPTPPAVPSDIYLIDDAGKVFSMERIGESSRYLSVELGSIGSSFRVVEKYTDENTIDYSGKVYAVKDGEIALVGEGEGEPIAVEPAYAVYGKKPWKLYFDTEKLEIQYREGFWKGGQTSTELEVTEWVHTLPHGCEVAFIGYDKPISEMVNLAIFDEIDEEACTARYIGVSENFEMWTIGAYSWIYFTPNIHKAENKLYIIGKNASFPQDPYVECPIGEADFSKYLPVNAIDENTYRTYIYLADDYAFYLYTDRAWGAPVNAWTSLTPDILVPHGETYTYGTQNVDKSFAPGVYLLEYRKSENSVGLYKAE